MNEELLERLKVWFQKRMETWEILPGEFRKPKNLMELAYALRKRAKVPDYERKA